MIDTPSFTLFLIASVTLLVTPGPAVIYIIARSIDQGSRAGLASTLGMAAGGLIHVAAAALGVSALLMSSVTAFNFIKYLGAGYLIYLGIRTLLTKNQDSDFETGQPESLTHIFSKAVAVQILNPKAAIFIFAFLPQFVDTTRGNIPAQLLLLGLIFIGIAICTDALYALLAGSIGNWLRRNEYILKAQRRFAGLVYIVLGVVTALTGIDKK